MNGTLTAVWCLGAMLLAAAASAGETPAAGEKPLKGKKAVFVIAPTKYRDEELKEPMAILQARGCAVTVASSTLKPVKGMRGRVAKPTVLLAEVKAEDYDAIVFVGGSGAKVYFDDATAHALAKAGVAKGKLVAAICIAPCILARAGVLKGKTATAYGWLNRRTLRKHGARTVKDDVVRDGKIITANGPEAAKRFGQFLAQSLAE